MDRQRIIRHTKRETDMFSSSSLRIDFGEKISFDCRHWIRWIKCHRLISLQWNIDVLHRHILYILQMKNEEIPKWISLKSKTNNSIEWWKQQPNKKTSSHQQTNLFHSTILQVIDFLLLLSLWRKNILFDRFEQFNSKHSC